MPTGRVSIYRLLFVILFVCTVTDFCAEDKASVVKFRTVVHRRPGRPFWGNFAPQEAPEAKNLIMRVCNSCGGLNIRGPCAFRIVQRAG